jgi:phosphoribosylformimino-5-aminoimidazole carboxamide ribotide isomerase
VNQAAVAAVAAAVAVPIEASGGLRTLADIEAAFAAGVSRVQLGSAALDDPELVRLVAGRSPERLVVSIDSRGGVVMADGWARESGREPLALALEMVGLGVRRLMVTDIGRDGEMLGPDLEGIRTLVGLVGVPVIASGGVTTLAHIRALSAAGCEGAVVGRALYEGSIDLREAMGAVA